MAVINIRVEDRIRDQLKELADAEGVSLSEYVRALLMEVVVPVYQPPVEHGDEPAPESMRIFDRQVLSLLHRILARVLPEDANDDDGDKEYQLERARVIESGFTGEYWREVAGFRTELSKRDCDRVLDILDMFRVITFSIARLAKNGTPVSEDLAFELEFQGFDYQDGLESHMAEYVEHLMSDGRWTELRPQLDRNDGGNSHHRTLDTYMRMLAEYRRIKDARGRGLLRDDYLLSMEELEQISAARVHPSHRGPAHLGWPGRTVAASKRGVSVASKPRVQQGGAAALLADAYRRAPGGYVAFLDESFELGANRPTFYLMSAVVAHRDQLEPLRDGLLDVVGDRFWHTTESLLTPDGRQKAVEVAQYLGDEKGTEVCLVSCRMPLGDGGGDAARRACLGQLASSLCTGAQPLAGEVHLMVLERRETQRERSYDAKIVSGLRAEKTICRHCQLKQASPRDEKLLWLPDLVSSAVRRNITHQEKDLLGPIEHIVQVLNCP